MKTLQMNQKADYGNWVPAAMMKTLWTATAAIAIVTVLMFVLIKSPVPGIIGIVVTLAALLPSRICSAMRLWMATWKRFVKNSFSSIRNRLKK